MQLLLEEFFSKVWKLNESGSIFLKFAVRLIVALLVVGVIYLIVKAVLSKNYMLLIVIIVFLILAEVAHFIRKSREKVMVDKATTENQIKKAAKESLKPLKSKNKDLLNSNKPKNKILLEEKSKIIRKEKFEKLNVDKNVLKPLKSKNKDLLNSNKPKNKGMLDLKKRKTFKR